MIIAITSPDAISINMFTEFLTKGILRGAAMVNISGLLSADFQTKLVEDAVSSLPGRDIIFRHKTRRLKAISKLPELLMEKADCVVAFDLYSTHPEVLKNFPGWTENVVSDFEKKIGFDDQLPI